MKQHIGIAILRVVLGITFTLHGLQKIQGGIDNIAMYFTSLGLPGFLAYIVTFIELLGGIALILGIGTRVVSVLITLIMLGAIFKARLEVGFIGAEGAGFEFELALAAMALSLVFIGGGQYSLDRLLTDKKSVE